MVPSVIVVSVCAGVEPIVAVPTVPDVPAPANAERTCFHKLSADKGNKVYLAPENNTNIFRIHAVSLSLSL